MQMLVQQGFDRMVWTPVALRGARLALVRNSMQASADAEESFASLVLSIVSYIEDRQIDRITVYDLNDEDRAIAELERRYIDGEGAPYEEMLSLVAEGSEALNQRDWDRMIACFSPDVADVAHSFAGWDSRRGRAETTEAMIDFIDAVGGARATTREIRAVTNEALLTTTVMSGRSHDGGAVERLFHTLFHRTGRMIDHMETFEADSLVEAHAAYRGLSEDTERGNRCTEVFGRWAGRFAARDWDGLGALVTDDYIYIDHRPVVGLREVGRDACRRTMQILAEQGGDRVVFTVLATRRDRHALLRLGVQSDGDAEDSFASVMLGVVTSSPDDRFAGITVFGLDDEERARIELERQYECRGAR
jgi:ketosteroid isomerase-like protein